jgi:hypothetical protein
MILIFHHSVGDGLSASFSLMCASDKGYDPNSNIIPFKNLNLIQKSMMVLAGLLVVPIAFTKNIMLYDNPNPFNNKQALCGVKRCSVSKDFQFE